MSTALVPGSLQAIAQRDGQSLAESFLSADAIVIVDVSGSMRERDVDGYDLRGRSRYEAACDELRKLQASLPGKIAMIAFSDTIEFSPAGLPRLLGGGTDMAAALRFVHIADDTGVRFILISDGQPNDKDATLRAAKTFTSKIDTVFIGPEGDSGAAFLRELADASGGRYQRNNVGKLADSVQLLLAAGA